MDEGDVRVSCRAIFRRFCRPLNPVLPCFHFSGNCAQFIGSAFCSMCLRIILNFLSQACKSGGFRCFYAVRGYPVAIPGVLFIGFDNITVLNAVFFK